MYAFRKRKGKQIWIFNGMPRYPCSLSVCEDGSFGLRTRMLNTRMGAQLGFVSRVCLVRCSNRPF